MYLTDKKNGVERTDDHEELEVLLESFAKQVEEVVNEAENIEVRFLVCCRRHPLISVDLEQRSVYTRNRGINTRFQPQSIACIGSQSKSE